MMFTQWAVVPVAEANEPSRASSTISHALARHVLNDRRLG